MVLFGAKLWYCLERRHGTVWCDGIVLFCPTEGIRFNREENIPEMECGLRSKW